MYSHVSAVPILSAIVDQYLFASLQSSAALSSPSPETPHPRRRQTSRTDEDANPPFPFPSLLASVGRDLHQAVAELGVGLVRDAVEVVGHARLVAAVRRVDAEPSPTAASKILFVELMEAQVVVAAHVGVFPRVRVHSPDVQAEEGRWGHVGRGEEPALPERRVVRRTGDGAYADAVPVVWGRDERAGDLVQRFSGSRGPAQGVAHVWRHGRGVYEVREILHLLRPVLGRDARCCRVGGSHSSCVNIFLTPAGRCSGDKWSFAQFSFEGRRLKLFLQTSGVTEGGRWTIR